MKDITIEDTAINDKDQSKIDEIVTKESMEIPGDHDLLGIYDDQTLIGFLYSNWYEGDVSVLENDFFRNKNPYYHVIGFYLFDLSKGEDLVAAVEGHFAEQASGDKTSLAIRDPVQGTLRDYLLAAGFEQQYDPEEEVNYFVTMFGLEELEDGG